MTYGEDKNITKNRKKLAGVKLISGAKNEIGKLKRKIDSFIRDYDRAVGSGASFVPDRYRQKKESLEREILKTMHELQNFRDSPILVRFNPDKKRKVEKIIMTLFDLLNKDLRKRWDDIWYRTLGRKYVKSKAPFKKNPRHNYKTLKDRDLRYSTKHVAGYKAPYPYSESKLAELLHGMDDLIESCEI